MNALGINQIGILYENNGFGNSGIATLEEVAPEYGIGVLAGESYESKANDVYPELNILMNTNVQAVVNWALHDVQVIVPKNMRELNMSSDSHFERFLR